MKNEVIEPLVTIAAGVIGVAILAVLVSRRSATPQVIGAAGSAFSNVLSAATAPVTGAASPPVNTGGYGGFGGMSFGQLGYGLNQPALTLNG